MDILGHSSPKLICTVQAPTLVGTSYYFSVVLGILLWFLYVGLSLCMCVFKSDHHSRQPAATPNVVVTGNYIVGWVVSVTIIAVLGGSRWSLCNNPPIHPSHASWRLEGPST